jgi:hypothetical protein
MFDLDRWREIFQSINKNKLRSVMSGFTVAFAILLFTLLFGIVSGLKNTFEGAFVDDAANSMIVRVWKTTKPFKGLQSNRRIQLKNPENPYCVLSCIVQPMLQVQVQWLQRLALLVFHESRLHISRDNLFLSFFDNEPKCQLECSLLDVRYVLNY